MITKFTHLEFLQNDHWKKIEVVLEQTENVRKVRISVWEALTSSHDTASITNITLTPEQFEQLKKIDTKYL